MRNNKHLLRMKIQINSLEALERLIGNDTEVEIEIRNSVVQAFVSKHLKSVASTEMVENAKEAIKKYVRETYFATIRHEYRDKIVFSDEMKKIIEFELSTNIRVQIKTLIDDIVKAKDIEAQVREKLQVASEYIESILKEDNLNRRLELMVNERLKKTLGITQ